MRRSSRASACSGSRRSVASAMKTLRTDWRGCRRDARSAFIASGVFLAGLLAATAAGLYPSILPARENRPFGLTVDNAASGSQALSVALYWWIPGMLLVVAWFTIAYRTLLRRL